MLTKINVNDSVGVSLAHDITEIRPGEFKGPAFRKGHVVCEGDLCHLQRLGKNHLYLIDLAEDEIHENEAAYIVASALSGEGVAWKNEPNEGKIKLHAAMDGLLKINVDALASFNQVEEVMCATLHNNTLVRKKELIAATRAIPLIMKRAPIENAAAIATQNSPVISVKPLSIANTGILITGNEVYFGIIKDKFAPVLRNKINDLGSNVSEVNFVPDDEVQIVTIINKYLLAGCDLILLSGGMSVDPDDVTRKAIKMAGARKLCYGASVLPGAMFLVAYINKIPILGIPACALHHKITVLDLILPRILAGEKIEKKDLALLGHGGLCQDCPDCIYPKCSFGKGM